jgi:hypothetical protein
MVLTRDHASGDFTVHGDCTINGTLTASNIMSGAAEATEDYLPSVDNSFKLGNSSKAWSNMYTYDANISSELKLSSGALLVWNDYLQIQPNGTIPTSPTSFYIPCNGAESRTFIMSEGDQTINGVKSFTSGLKTSPGVSTSFIPHFTFYEGTTTTTTNGRIQMGLASSGGQFYIRCLDTSGVVYTSPMLITTGGSGSSTITWSGWYNINTGGTVTTNIGTGTNSGTVTIGNSSNKTMFGSNVGIGTISTTSPVEKLHIGSTSGNAQIWLEADITNDSASGEFNAGIWYSADGAAAAYFWQGLDGTTNHFESKMSGASQSWRWLSNYVKGGGTGTTPLSITGTPTTCMLLSGAGLLTLGSGLSLPTSGGTASTFDFYQNNDTSQGTGWTGPWSGSNTITITVSRMGHRVFIKWPGFTGTNNTGSGSTNVWTKTTALASIYRPSADIVIGAIWNDSASGSKTCYVKITSAGVVTIGMTLSLSTASPPVITLTNIVNSAATQAIPAQTWVYDLN